MTEHRDIWTPWTITHLDDGSCRIVDADGDEVATCEEVHARAIVEAVNAQFPSGRPR